MEQEKPFDKLQNEGTKPYQAFTIYCSLGTQRSLQKVADQINKSVHTVKIWSAKFNWVSRAESYDLENAKALFEQNKREHALKIQQYYTDQEKIAKTTFAISYKYLLKIQSRLERLLDEDIESIPICLLPNTLKTVTTVASIALDFYAKALCIEELSEALDLINLKV